MLILPIPKLTSNLHTSPIQVSSTTSLIQCSFVPALIHSSNMQASLPCKTVYSSPHPTYGYIISTFHLFTHHIIQGSSFLQLRLFHPLISSTPSSQNRQMVWNLTGEQSPESLQLLQDRQEILTGENTNVLGCW